MEDWLSRTRLLLGEDGASRLQGAKIAVLGLGGVGGSCAESLCRAGVGSLLLIDNDVISPTNLNRQLLATCESVGQKKTEAARLRLTAVNPQISLTLADEFYLPNNCAFLFDYQPDVILDACDTVTAKLHLAGECQARGIPLVSCLGTGNRLWPQLLRVGDIFDTASSGCALARVMRRELRRRKITSLRVIYSAEQAAALCAGEENGRHPPGSISFVPPAAGCILASEAARLLICP